MLMEKFMELVKSIKNGRYVKASWKSVKMVGGLELEKISSGVVRMGIKYANIKKEKDTTTRQFNGKFIVDNMLIESQDKKGNTTHNVRLYPSKCKNHHTRVVYYYGGVEYSKQELIEMGVLETPKPRTSEMLCFTVKLENLISLG
jgi:hypothetical protein